MVVIGVCLAGSGVYDGSEIHESVITLLALSRAGATVICFAPDMPQMHVVNHLTGEVSPNETRNVLIESARIARGDIRSAADCSATDWDALIVPGGFGERGAEGKIRFIQYAREHAIPFLGLCYGFQLAVVEFARNVCGLKTAGHTEFDEHADTPVIYLLPEQRKLTEMGGTMRLGGYEVKIKKGTQAYKYYQTNKATERFRHRYEFNNEYKTAIEDHGMIFSGMTPDAKIMQILEISDHPYFIGTQFHPELTSRPYLPQPLFQAFVMAAKADTGKSKNDIPQTPAQVG